MALREALTTLATELHVLEDSVRGLRATILEDAPEPSHAAVVGLGYPIQDLVGHLAEATAAVHDGLVAFTSRREVDAALNAVATCQEQVNLAARQLYGELLAYDRLVELSKLSHERGGAWRSWLRPVRRGLEDCETRVHDLNDALLACWREIGERVGTTSVSVQATNIGQQVTVPGGELVNEGLT
ncbi:MAG: hypothetical protein M3P34_10265 [Actinomycetota bacterium]|nr:hypothetical protein [Actinomycetota bacterium]